MAKPTTEILDQPDEVLVEAMREIMEPANLYLRTIWISQASRWSSAAPVYYL